MQISLSKLPWYGQIGAFVLVCAAAAVGFWQFYVQEANADMALRRARLVTLNAGAAKGRAAARRLPEFQREVTDLETRLESLSAVLPEEKDVADILRRLQTLAAQSNLRIQRFTPQPGVQQAMYLELPFKLQAEGTYHNLGYFFDRVSRFPRIINISGISLKAKNEPEPDATIVAELTATTFVVKQGEAVKAGGGTIPKQPSLNK